MTKIALERLLDKIKFEHAQRAIYGVAHEPEIPLDKAENNKYAKGEMDSQDLAYTTNEGG